MKGVLTALPTFGIGATLKLMPDSTKVDQAHGPFSTMATSPRFIAPSMMP